MKKSYLQLWAAGLVFLTQAAFSQKVKLSF